jgi:ribosomal subunit interface protein
MNIEMTARHFTPSEKLRELVDEKVGKIEKFNHGILNCHVVLTKDASGEAVEIKVHAKGHDFVSHDNASVFEISLVNAVEKIKTQLVKHHDKAMGK